MTAMVSVLQNEGGIIMWIDEEGWAEKIFHEEYAQQEARKILEVDENADLETLKKAYKCAYLKYHPDHNPNNPDADKRFLLVQCAYEFLTKHTIFPMLLKR